MKHKVVVLGGGALATTLAKVIAENCSEHPAVFEPVVTMSFVDESVNGKKLSEWISKKHENPKYLPGVKLPDNLVADPKPEVAAASATILVFAFPIQYLSTYVSLLKSKLTADAVGLSVVTGLTRPSPDSLLFASEIIESELNVPCDVVSGLHSAHALATGHPSAIFLGSVNPSLTGNLFTRLLSRPYLKVQMVSGVEAVEYSEIVRSCVSVLTGFLDGLGLAVNSKAAATRYLIKELTEVSSLINPNISSGHAASFLSNHMVDIVLGADASAERKCAEKLAQETNPKVTWDHLEHKLANGTKLYGHVIVDDVSKWVHHTGKLQSFKLLHALWRAAIERADASVLLQALRASLVS